MPKRIFLSTFGESLTLPKEILAKFNLSINNVNKNLKPWLYFFYIFLIEGLLLYNIVLVSAVHKHESAIAIHMSPPSWASLPPPTSSHPSSLLQSSGLSSLSHTADSPWLSILYMVMYMSPCYSHHSSHPLLLPTPPPRVHKSCSLCLRLHCWPANRFISTIFEDTTYMHKYVIFVLVSDLTSFCMIGSRVIHLIRTDSDAFLFMSE